jgi:hypothetical protein
VVVVALLVSPEKAAEENKPDPIAQGKDKDKDKDKEALRVF